MKAWTREQNTILVSSGSSYSLNRQTRRGCWPVSALEKRKEKILFASLAASSQILVTDRYLIQFGYCCIPRRKLPGSLMCLSCVVKKIVRT